MAKLKTDPINAADMVTFLDSQSDFSFEMRVMEKLVALGFQCEHGGSYDDPATKKPRQFDIRATHLENNIFLMLAVECKNVRVHYPLLVTCVPRLQSESFHQVAFSVNSDYFDLGSSEERADNSMVVRAMRPESINLSVGSPSSIYSCGQPVGKSCDQIGRLASGGDITSSDSEVFEKWAQALGSAEDLVNSACTQGKDLTAGFSISLVVPIVVVPDGRLWAVDYSASGERVGDPKQVDRCSFFVNRKYSLRTGIAWSELVLSHLEFLTLKGVEQFSDLLKSGGDSFITAFAIDQIQKRWLKG